MDLKKEAQESINKDERQELIEAIKYRLQEIEYYQKRIKNMQDEIILIENGKLSEIDNLGEMNESHSRCH